jgi:hypothetical protein
LGNGISCKAKKCIPTNGLEYIGVSFTEVMGSPDQNSSSPIRR